MVDTGEGETVVGRELLYVVQHVAQRPHGY